MAAERVMTCGFRYVEQFLQKPGRDVRGKRFIMFIYQDIIKLPCFRHTPVTRYRWKIGN